MLRCRNAVCVYLVTAAAIVFILSARLLRVAELSRPTIPFDVTSRRGLAETSDVYARCTQSDRQRLLRRQCAALSSRYSAEHVTSATERYSFLLVDDKHKVIYCAIPKAASTTWKTVLARASGHPLTESMSEHQVEDWNFLANIGLRYLSTYSEKEIKERLANYFKFTIVRHPFLRLLSAYHDKVARFNSYGLDIRRQITKNENGRSRHTEADRSNLFRRITFGQFVRYVIASADQGTKFDHHWAPYGEICHFCHVEYDYIGKLETTVVDSVRLYDRLATTNRNASSSPRQPSASAIPQLNTRRDAKSSSSSRSAMASPLSEFGAVGEAELERLADIYGEDMKMFGYGWRGNAQSGSLWATCNTDGLDDKGACC